MAAFSLDGANENAGRLDDRRRVHENLNSQNEAKIQPQFRHLLCGAQCVAGVPANDIVKV